MRTEVPDPRPPGPTGPDPEPPAPEPPQPPEPHPPPIGRAAVSGPTTERGVDDNLECRCELCGATLTAIEIAEAREHGRPFVCSVHAAEELPAVPDDDPQEPEVD